ncbi:hypothetical protein CPB86DRAFT_293705 [Serendipita vermifera]|nr:hypothetical protein CPB86DRAFT_293705 [Serendipita vermifera]
MATKWYDAKGPQSVWSLQDVVLDQIGIILEARAAAELQFLEKVKQELVKLDSALDSLLHPMRVTKGKLSSEPHPLTDVWQGTFIGQFISQFSNIIQAEFALSREEYDRLRQEMETFRQGAQAIRTSRPAPGDVEQVEQALITAVRRCENSKEVYDKRCQEFQNANAKPKSRLGSLKNLRHGRNASNASLLSMDEPGVNTADHDYRKAVVVANTLRDQRVSIYQSGYPTLQNSTEQTLELAKSALLVHASLTTERSSARMQRYETVVDKLMLWKPQHDAAQICSFIQYEQNSMPPEIFRQDAVMGWMRRVVFCVPLSYLPTGNDGVPRILEQCFGVCLKILESCNWDEQEAGHFAATPKLSASRFEQVIVAVEREESELAVAVRSIPEALGLMNYLFFSLPRPLLQLNSSVASDPDLCRTWWESSKDRRKVAELFKPDTLDKSSERTLRFLLEQISKILPHATNLHIVDIAMTWAKPLFQSPRPSNAEITALCVLFRQALLLHRHLYDERWLGLWNRYSRRVDTPPLTPLRSPVSSNHTAVVRSPHSRQNTLTNKI